MPGNNPRSRLGFEPLGKHVDEVTKEDIFDLEKREVAEGLFIEYKADFPSNRKIAHSIASFANSHGGWYILGVEADKATNVPRAFPGVDLCRRPTPKDDIRNVIVGNIAPVPRFESKLVKSDDDHGFLVVYVPESDDPPHICGDGRIYRRNGEGGDPVPETDRHAIDRLYDKREEKRQRIERFCQNPRSMSEAQAREMAPWLEIYCIPEPPLDPDMIDLFQCPDEVKRRFQESVQLNVGIPDGEVVPYATSTMPLDVMYSGWRRVVLEQRLDRSPARLNLTVELYDDGRCKMFLPFTLMDPRESNCARLQRVVERGGLEDDLFSIVNGFDSMAVFFHLLGQYVHFLGDKGWQDELLIKYRLTDVWRAMLFLDCPTFENQVTENGIPVCYEDTIEMPDADHTMHVTMAEHAGNEFVFLVVQWSLIASALGVFQKNVTNVVVEWAESVRAQQADT